MRIVTVGKLALSGALALSLTAAALQPAAAASAVEIDAEVDAALVRFYEEVPAAKDLAKQAKGMLIFPSVVKAGFGVGGEYGEGALRVGGRSAGYYNTAAASIGLQIGVQSRTEVLLFMTQEALDRFQASDGWEVGVDGSVAVVRTGVAGEIDTTTLGDPVIGFIFGEQGLMANLSLEGAKITKMDKS
jgi:lipid-binding SYLF domain-containing protein